MSVIWRQISEFFPPKVNFNLTVYVLFIREIRKEFKTTFHTYKPWNSTSVLSTSSLIIRSKKGPWSPSLLLTLNQPRNSNTLSCIKVRLIKCISTLHSLRQKATDIHIGSITSSTADLDLDIFAFFRLAVRRDFFFPLLDFDLFPSDLITLACTVETVQQVWHRKACDWLLNTTTVLHSEREHW